MPVNEAESIRALVIACCDELGGQRRFEAEAGRRGSPVSRQTISNIYRGVHTGKFDEQTLAAIAAVSGWTAERVHELAKQPMPTGEFAAQLPRDVDQLDQTSRQAIIDVINSMLRLQRTGELSTATVTPIGNASPAKETRLRAARRGSPGKGRTDA